MKLKALLTTACLCMGLLCLTACGGVDERTYQYPETTVLFNDFHIIQTVYSPGVMKVYYRGGQLKDNPIRCYDANFEDLGDQFKHTFRNGVLIVEADFAEEISGLTIEDMAHDVVYRLRYLDSPQFAWLADTLWYDYGWMEMGDAERYYSEAELKAQADLANKEQQETLVVFAALEGTWVSEDGLQKYVFSVNEEGNHLTVKESWYHEMEQNWVSWEILVKSAFQSEYYNAMGEEDDNFIEIRLSTGDPSAMDSYILYNPQENTIQVNDTTYRWTESRE